MESQTRCCKPPCIVVRVLKQITVHFSAGGSKAVDLHQAVKGCTARPSTLSSLTSQNATVEGWIQCARLEGSDGIELIGMRLAERSFRLLSNWWDEALKILMESRYLMWSMVCVTWLA